MIDDDDITVKNFESVYVYIKVWKNVSIGWLVTAFSSVHSVVFIHTR